VKVKRAVWVVALIVVGPLVLGWLVALGVTGVMDRTNGSIVLDGVRRRYLVHVPPTYDRTKPTPLVISLHGAGGWPAQQANLSRWNRVADQQGFIVAYPAGTGLPQIWHVFRDNGLRRDVRFITAMIDTIERTYNIDSTRVYANGVSNGGGMAFVLSCALAGRIAAIGLVASAQTLPASWCADHQPMPMIAFHGTADPIVPFAGGHWPMAPETFPNIGRWVADWAQRDRCSSTPRDSIVSASVTRREYERCADGSAVVFYIIKGGGHTWPGGKPLPRLIMGYTSREVDATREMWDFFRQHRLLRTSVEGPK
jgi:polyhydroxybutyrate depolymerase